MAVKHYVDEIPPAGGRTYQIVTSGNTSKIHDITEYEQDGTSFGSADVNSTCILECNYSKSGTVHMLTTENTASENIKFFATEDFNINDTIKFNNEIMTVKSLDGVTVNNTVLFKKNTYVSCLKKGNTLYFQIKIPTIETVTVTPEQSEYLPFEGTLKAIPALGIVIIDGCFAGDSLLAGDLYKLGTIPTAYASKNARFTPLNSSKGQVYVSNASIFIKTDTEVATDEKIAVSGLWCY